ncbi:ferredoxin [Rhodococcus sp. WS3]|uniref:ferredoxin n=1 Tax=Rhodococcus sp. WS3 TaxID=2486271 RepID=UPI0011419059|nr:ferredoxin [Rhodococcus sp. WS3]ROZ49000.1 ferredoxin [Rhodococcus sp. WS3]
MRVEVDADRCQGHTLCALAAPNVFELDDIDGHSSVPDQSVVSEFASEVRTAVATCPERAIRIED